MENVLFWIFDYIILICGLFRYNLIVYTHIFWFVIKYENLPLNSLCD